MNKKIAILTQPLGNNYGGIIQNYALQKVLKDLGFQPTTIDRQDNNPHSVLKRRLSTLKSWVSKSIFNDKRISHLADLKIFANNVRFISEHISISNKIDSDNNFYSYFQKNHYDAVIVGSDQTWRPSYSPNIYNYFLDFLAGDKTIKKLAYATSFGTDKWEFNEEEAQRCGQLAQEFDAVSVREQSGVALCKDYLRIDAEWVLDPTFLLSKEDYLKVAKLKNTPKRHGVFSYILDANDEIESTITTIANKLGVSQFTSQPKWRRNDKTGQKLEDLIYPGLESWLKAFDDADFIVTNSFHGTVFSIIFNKPFITIVNKERGASRFHSLLSLLGLENRLLTDASQIDELLNQQIDYTAVNPKIDELREQSVQFLKTNLKNK